MEGAGDEEEVLSPGPARGRESDKAGGCGCGESGRGEAFAGISVRWQGPAGFLHGGEWPVVPSLAR